MNCRSNGWTIKRVLKILKLTCLSLQNCTLSSSMNNNWRTMIKSIIRLTIINLLINLSIHNKTNNFMKMKYTMKGSSCNIRKTVIIMKMSKTKSAMSKIIWHLITWSTLMRYMGNMKAIMEIHLIKWNKIILAWLMILIKNSFKLALLITVSLSLESLRSFWKIINSDCLNILIIIF